MVYIKVLLNNKEKHEVDLVSEIGPYKEGLGESIKELSLAGEIIEDIDTYFLPMATDTAAQLPIIERELSETLEQLRKILGQIAHPLQASTDKINTALDLYTSAGLGEKAQTRHIVAKAKDGLEVARDTMPRVDKSIELAESSGQEILDMTHKNTHDLGSSLKNVEDGVKALANDITSAKEIGNDHGGLV